MVAMKAQKEAVSQSLPVAQSQSLIETPAARLCRTLTRPKYSTERQLMQLLTTRRLPRFQLAPFLEVGFDGRHEGGLKTL
jgi:hypothetical protein